MNQRLQGWQLALALLIPALVIGAAGYIAYGALSEDDQDLATGEDDAAVDTTPTATSTTQPDTAEPTDVAEPTALVVPTAEPVPTTTVGAATPTPTATTEPPPQPTSPTGPAPTATSDPSVVTIACGGTVPGSIEVDESFGPLTATTTPPEAASSLQFTWTLGDTTTVTSPATGNISYSSAGSYTISLLATNPANGSTASATCGTVTVTEAVISLEVSCSVSSVFGLPVDQAGPGDQMRVTTTWTPSDVPLYLQYEFETTDQLIIVNPASSGNTQDNSFSTNEGMFRIFWRYEDNGEAGRVSCPAYPGVGGGTAPTATVAPTTVVTPTPTVGTTTPSPSPSPSPTPTETTPAITPTPTPTQTVDAATPTPTETP